MEDLPSGLGDRCRYTAWKAFLALIPLKDRHLCPACGDEQIAQCYFAGQRHVFQRRRSAYRCPKCNTQIRYAAERSVLLIVARLLAVVVLGFWASRLIRINLSSANISTAEIFAYFTAAIIIGVVITLVDMLRGSVVAAGGNATSK